MTTSGRLVGLLIILVIATTAVLLIFRSDESTSAGSAPALQPGESPALVGESGAALEPLAAAPGPERRGDRREAVVTAKAALATESETEKTAAPSGPFLYGTVASTDGFPIVDADVRVRAGTQTPGVVMLASKALSERTTTTRGGEFKVPRGLLPLREVTVEIRARGFIVSDIARAPDTESGDARLGTFVLERGVVLAGRVVDAKGNPVAAASVRRTSIDDAGAFSGLMGMANAMGGPNPSRTETDEEGRFELGHEISGEYALIVEHDAYPKGRFEGQAPPVGGEDVNLVLRMQPAARLEGRILGFPAGKRGVTLQATAAEERGKDNTAPIAAFFESAGLSAEHASSVDSDGTFLIEGLHVGERYHVQAFTKEGIFGKTPCSDIKTVDSGSSGLELTWDAGARLLFEVQNAGTGKALSNVTVRYRWTGESGMGMPNAQQKQEFSSSPIVLSELRPRPSPGTLEFAIVVDGFLEHRVEGIEVIEGKDVELGVYLLRPAPNVRVQVVDAATGKPLKRARVQLQPDVERSREQFFALHIEGSNGKTDGDGWCVLPACASETATLSVRKSGYSNYELAEVSMPKDAPTEEIVRLYKGGSVEIRVVDTNDQPVQGVEVVHRAPSGSTTTKMITGTQSETRMRDLAPGEHAFRARRSTGRRRGMVQVNAGELGDSAEEWRTAMVLSGATTSLVLEIPAHTSVSGVVTSRGIPVVGARVTLLQGEEEDLGEELRAEMAEEMRGMMPGSPSATTTDANGDFTLPSVPTGRHRLMVRRKGGTPSHTMAVELRDGNNRADIALPSARIEGRVLDTKGRRIEGAEIEVEKVSSDLDNGGREGREFARQFFGGGSRRSLESASDGSFEVDGLPHGVPIVVTVRSSGYVGGRSEILTLSEDEVERGVDVVLTEAGSIRVLVADTLMAFRPVRANFVGETEGVTHPRSAMALPRAGEALLKDLAPGSWRVKLSGGGGDDDGQLVEVHPGEESQADLRP